MGPSIRRLMLYFVLIAPMPLVAADNPEQLIKAGHWKRARAALEAAPAANAANPAWLVQMAKVKRAYGDTAQALKLAEKAVALSGSSEAHFVLGQVMGESLSKASMFRQMMNASKVRKAAEAAIAADRRNPQPHYLLMMYFLEAPGIVGGGKDKARAEQAEVAKLDPALGYLAEAEFAEKEKLMDAIPELYRKAHDANPRAYDTAYYYCGNLLNRKQWAGAERCARDLIKLDPDRVTGYNILAANFGYQQRWAETEAVLGEAEKNVPDNLTPYYNVGRAAHDAGDFARAERYLRKYLSQEPEPTAPKFSRARWRLALALEKLGRKPEAVAELRSAVSLDPEFDAAKKDLKRLQ